METKYIFQNIHESDAALNVIIQEYIDGPFYFGTETTIAGYRIANYEMLRKWAYPDPMVKNDVDVKIGSDIPALISEGEVQLAQYIQDCLNVKTRFPKS